MEGVIYKTKREPASHNTLQFLSLSLNARSTIDPINISHCFNSYQPCHDWKPNKWQEHGLRIPPQMLLLDWPCFSSLIATFTGLHNYASNTKARMHLPHLNLQKLWMSNFTTRCSFNIVAMLPFFLSRQPSRSRIGWMGKDQTRISELPLAFIAFWIHVLLYLRVQ